MSKLLIFTLFISLSAFGASVPKKGPKTPVKALKTVSVRLSSTYIQNYKSSSVVIRIQPKTLPEGKKLMMANCKKNDLDCAIFPDSQQANLLNISVRGSSASIKNLLHWMKANSSQYTETKHQKK